MSAAAAESAMPPGVDPGAQIGRDTRVWPGTQVAAGARVGRDCVICRDVYLGPGVTVGDRCKIKDQALIYEPSVLEDGVFVGPGAVLTNDAFPRAITPDGRLKTGEDWELVGVRLRQGAAIGARAVLVAPVVVGRWAMVAAGAVVVDDVPDFALVAGVPARQIGWVGPSGRRLVVTGPDRFSCPVTDAHFVLCGTELLEVP